MSDKLEDLEKRLNAVRKANDSKKVQEETKDSDNQSMNKGMQAGVELVTSVLAGGFLGYLLDQWLGTPPLFLIIFLLGGMGAGFLGVYKITNDAGSTMGFSSLHQQKKKGKKAPSETKDD